MDIENLSLNLSSNDPGHWATRLRWHSIAWLRGSKRTTVREKGWFTPGPRTARSKEVDPLRLVELEGGGEGVEDGIGDSGEVSALQLGLVLGADPGPHGDLFSLEALDPPGAAPFADPSLGFEPDVDHVPEHLAALRALDIKALLASAATEGTLFDRSRQPSLQPQDSSKLATMIIDHYNSHRPLGRLIHDYGLVA